MGKIFGISDLPVSTIMTPFKPIEVEPKKVTSRPKNTVKNFYEQSRYATNTTNKFVNQSFIKQVYNKLFKNKFKHI